MTKNTTVNIAMVTYNRLYFTKLAIESILTLTTHPHILTVVDNNSQDGTRDYLCELKRKGSIQNLFLLDENVGLAKAANIAWLA
ncbi:MAG TPA: glycosyltransferase, partial [Candidatus Bathyarchaeia archaeon]|nr:glycosyltransferase [Candidatus Bathyarchaeia archaeon]